MKSYSPLTHSGQTVFRLPFYEEKTQHQPFFKPAKLAQLPSVTVKTLMADGQKVVLLTMDADAENFLKQLLIFLKNNCSLNHENPKSPDAETMGLNDACCEYLNKVDKIISENLHKDGFGGSDLAKLLCCCEMQLYRKLKKLTNLSPANYIRQFRLRQSIVLLEQTKQSITEICFHVGFNSLEYFSRSFKKEFGVSPSAIREANMLV